MTTIVNKGVLLSIVVPAYQAERTIRRAVSSVLKLDEGAIEVIVVDDGSTDGTSAILSSLATSDPRVKVVAQENRGRSAARNKGVEVSSGQWVMFMDADDYLLASGLSVLVDRCKASDSPLVVFGMRGNGEQRRGACSMDTQADIAYVSAATLAKVMLDNYVFDIVDNPGIYDTNAVWARLYRRDLLLRLSELSDGIMVPFPEGLRFSEDRLLNLAYLRQLGAEPIEFVPVELYFWDFEESQTCGVLHKGDPASLDAFCDLVRKMDVAGIVDEEEAESLVAREAVGQFQRLVKLAHDAEPALLDEYIALFTSPDIVRAVARTPSDSYCCTSFWRAIGHLIGLNRAWLAFRLSVLAFRAKGNITQRQNRGVDAVLGCSN